MAVGPAGSAAGSAASGEGSGTSPAAAPLLPQLRTLRLEMKETMVCTTNERIKFEVPIRYDLQFLCGSGPLGVVCQAEDLDTHERVAIKKVPRVFDHQTMTLCTLREIRTLRHLKHENLIRVRNIFFSGCEATFSAIYVVTDFMEMDLAQVLKSGQPLAECHLKVLSYQILRGLKYLHSAQIIHRGLKPQNILVNGSCELKICDLGLARLHFHTGQWAHSPTQYTPACWYSAPELLCAQTHFTDAVDIWSLGCVFAEMHTTTVLFSGSSAHDQLKSIIALLGSPTDDELRRTAHGRCRSWICTLHRRDPVPLERAFGSMTEPARWLLLQMLHWDPKGRSSALGLLQDPYLEWLHLPEDEPTREPLDAAEYAFEQGQATPLALREELLREALYYNPEPCEQAQGGGAPLQSGVLVAPPAARGPQADTSQCDLLLPGLPLRR